MDQIASGTGELLGKRYAPARKAATSTFVFDTSMVLYSKLRPYLNKVVVPDEPGVATTELIGFCPDPQLVDRMFLAYYLRSPMFVNFASRNVAGAKMPRVVTADLWRHEILIPALTEQRRIVEILDRAQEISRMGANAWESASRLPSALFERMFGVHSSDTSAGSRRPLGELLGEPPQNGLYKPASEYGRGTRIVRIDSFYDGSAVDMASLRLVNLAVQEIEQYRLDENDLVLNRVNSMEYLGKVAIVPSSDKPMVFESNMMRLRVDPAAVDPVFALQHLQMPATRALLLQKAKRAVNQASVNQTDVQSVPILVPPISEQRRFGERWRAIQSLRERQLTAKKMMDGLFTTLLHKAFAGTLTARWREAHMAELVQEMEHQSRTLAVAERSTAVG